MRYNWKTMQRKFGHCVANWSIVNSHMLPVDSPFQILSPEFEVKGINATKWEMKLKNEEIDGEFQLHFLLENLKSDNANLLFYGEIKVEIFSRTAEGISFRKDFIWEVNPNEKRLNGRIQPKHNFNILLLYNLHIECKMIIWFLDVEEDIETFSDVKLKDLSTDVLWLYEIFSKRKKTKESTDVILKVNDSYSVHQIKAHKRILLFSSTILKNISCSNTKYVTVDHFGRIDEWKKIVEFLHTADWRCVLRPPRASYYDISMAYNIEPIISFYQPDELNLYSTVPDEEFFVTCTIPESLISNGNLIKLPRLMNRTLDTKLKIDVYPRGTRDESDTFFFIVLDGEIPKSFRFEIYASNALSKDLLYRMYGKIANNANYEKRCPLKSEILNHYLVDGNLTLGFKLQTVNLYLLNECKRSSTTYIKCKPSFDGEKFLTLAIDMMKEPDVG